MGLLIMISVTYYSISDPSLTATFLYSSGEVAASSGHPRACNCEEATREASVFPTSGSSKKLGIDTIGVPAHRMSIPVV